MNKKDVEILSKEDQAKAIIMAAQHYRMKGIGKTLRELNEVEHEKNNG